VAAVEALADPAVGSRFARVERFFALLTERALRRGLFQSVADLENAIKAYIAATNERL
jgi:hypothetical protein